MSVFSSAVSFSDLSLYSLTGSFIIIHIAREKDKGKIRG